MARQRASATVVEGDEQDVDQTETDNGERFVRLKPYNPKRGIKVRRYHIGGVLFREDRGWHLVKDQALLEKLEGLTQDRNDPDSPLLFDIVTREEAEAIDEKDSNAQRLRGHSGNATRIEGSRKRAVTVTTRDDKSRIVAPVAPMGTDVADITTNDGEFPNDPPLREHVDPEDTTGTDNVEEMQDDDDGRIAGVGRAAGANVSKKKARGGR